MASEEDLVEAIKETLEADGTLNTFKAEMRSQVIKILETGEDKEKPRIPRDNLLIHELIREYLQWCGYKYTKAMLIQETGLNCSAVPRKQILQELGVIDTEESSKLPIIVGLVEAFKTEAEID